MMVRGGSRSAVLPHSPGESSSAVVALTPRAEVDAEMGHGLAGALYDEQAWAAGEILRKASAGFAEEDYVPASLARQRLQTVVADMDAMRKSHHAMMLEVRKNYEVIGEETKKYYTKYIGDLGDRYNRSLQGLKKVVDKARAAEEAMRAEVVPLRDELVAREQQVDELRQEVKSLDAARSAAAEEAAAAKATAAEVAAQAAQEAQRHHEASEEAARAAAAAAADVESQREAEREALRSGNDEAAAAAKAQREAAEARARAAEQSSRKALDAAKAAQLQAAEAAEAEQEAVMEEVVQQSALPQSLPGALQDGPRVQELEASVASLEESMVKVEAELQEKNAQIAELCKQLRSGEEAAALEQQRAAEAAAIEAGDTQAAAAAKAERESLEAKARESEAAAAAAAAQAVAARAKPAERAVYKVNLALLRARLSSQLQKTELATNLVESTQKRVAAEQRDKVERVNTAKAELAEAEQVATAVSAGLNVEGVTGSADVMTKVAEAQEQLAAAQLELAGLREHEAELERQREALEQEKGDMEAALAQKMEVSAKSANILKAEVARLEAAGKAATESLQKQKELSAGVVERLNGDLEAAQTELTAAQAVVKRPPAGRKPSEKKADREKVAAIKAKIDSLGLSIQQLTDGARWMEKAAEEPEPEQASAEAADLMAHSEADAARIGELEAQVANLQSANAALLENMGDEGTSAEAAAVRATPPAASGAQSAAGGDKVLAAKLARAEARAAAAEKALDDAKLSGKATVGGAKMSAADAKKAKAAEAKIKQLEAKNAKLADSLQIEKEKAAAASAGAKEGAAAEREKKKLAADAEKKLKAAEAETEKEAKRAEKKAAEAAELAGKLEAAEAELTKLQKQGAGASKELESLREQAQQLAIVQAHEAELDERLNSQTVEMNQLETRYKEQVTLRKKYYNMIEDMKGKIRVYARCRPMAKYEIEKECQPVVSFPDEYTVELKMEKGPPRQFAWDCAFTPASTQEETYEETAALIQSAIDGYNVCVFAYGQTGSGKTFTMVGAPGMEGILPRAMRDIYEKKAEMAAEYDMNVKCYMLELYNDQLLDLLVSKADKNAAKQANHGKEEQLQIKKDAKGMIFVPGSTVVDCPELSDLEHCWELGEKSRHVGATKMNAGSSRSHLIVSMLLETTNKQTGKSAVGKLSLIDLAGSERAGKTGATAERLREAQSINKSLSALGDVISALSSGEKFIPYRNNKLTLLMSDSLGGNAKTLMYVNISPADYNLEETLTSLAYAARVKLITNDAAKNEESKEVHRLKEQLKAVKAGELSPDDIEL